MSQGRILIVDDNESVRMGLRLLLEGEGYTVVEASNGSEALAFLEADLPAAIICDVEMPVMDGYQFRQALLQHPEFSLIPFFFLTGHTTIAEALHGLELYVDDYIPKTTSAAVLRKKIENAIHKHQIEQEKIKADLTKAAAALQLLPDKPPPVPGFSISHFHQPYQQTPGGDFFDYLPCKENTYVILGDVMGKQWSAWMFAQAYVAYVRSTIRSLATIASDTLSPASILTQLNAILCCDKKTLETLWTLAIAQLSHTDNTVTYASAAHVPSYLIETTSLIPRIIDHGSAPIGHSTATRYTDLSFTMNKGDLLIMVTDGITEASQKDGAEFGEEALLKVLSDQRDNPELAAALYAEAVRFTGENELRDDATVLVLQRQ